MDRIVKKAELDGAEAVIFDMDTPGGYAWYTQGLVLNSLQNLTIPTYSFVNPRAESAGAIIAIGTDTIYMRPAATIGSALVVGGGGGDLGESMTDKVTKEIMQMVENVAIIKGHNPDIAKAFVSKDTRVEIDGTVVHDGDGVLNLNSIRATEIIGGKPVLAKGIAIDLEDLVEQEGLTGEIVKAEALGMEAIAGWVQKFSFLLIMVGLAGAYMEMKAPGFGAPGLISVLCFSIFFFGNHMAGNLAGYELAVVFVIGIILIIVEIFLFPGLIFPALIGTLMVLGSLVFAMGDRVDFQWKMDGKPGALPWEDLFSGAMMNLAIALIGVGLILWWAMRFLPETRFRKLDDLERIHRRRSLHWRTRRRNRHRRKLCRPRRHCRERFTPSRKRPIRQKVSRHHRRRRIHRNRHRPENRETRRQPHRRRARLNKERRLSKVPTEPRAFYDATGYVRRINRV